jgi:hypothetical protein
MVIFFVLPATQKLVRTTSQKVLVQLHPNLTVLSLVLHIIGFYGSIIFVGVMAQLLFLFLKFALTTPLISMKLYRIDW